MTRDERRPLRFTAHAKDRLASRNVTEAEVEQAIRTGAWLPNVGEGWITRASLGGRTLDVVFVEKVDDRGEVVIEVLLVVTVIDVGRYKR